MTKKNKVNKLGVVLIEDWLVKSPPFTKIKNIKSWHKRYFALLQINRSQYVVPPKNWSKKGPKLLEDLHDVYLVYWYNSNDRKKGLKPIRTIPLFKSYVITDQQSPFFEDKFQHCFTLNTIERKYYMNAENKEQKTIWMDLLSQCIESVQGNEVHDIDKEPVYESILELLGKSENCDLPSPTSDREFRFPVLGKSLSHPPSKTVPEECHIYEKMMAADQDKHSPCLRTRSLDSPIAKPSNKINKTKLNRVRSSTTRESNASFDNIPHQDEPLYHVLEPEYIESSDSQTSSDSTSDLSECLDSGKKIAFQDLSLQVPSNSVLTYNKDSLLIQTSCYEYTVKMKHHDTYVDTLQWV